jgi:hypothetical protein
MVRDSESDVCLIVLSSKERGSAVASARWQCTCVHCKASQKHSQDQSSNLYRDRDIVGASHGVVDAL